MRGLGLGQIYGRRYAFIAGPQSHVHSRSSGSRGRGRLEEAVWYDARLLFGSVDHPWPQR